MVVNKPEISSIRELELELYYMKDKLNSYEVDMGPNGSFYPMRGYASDISRMLKFLERYHP